jgi:CrcB protein
MKHKLLLMIFIAIGGALGSLMRYILSGLVQNLIGYGFPWGTLAVNMIGCFTMGFVWNLIHNGLLPASLNVLVSVGFIGALTTFSTFGIETVHLFSEGKGLLALANIAFSVVCGLVLVYTGILTCRLFLN